MRSFVTGLIALLVGATILIQPALAAEEPILLKEPDTWAVRPAVVSPDSTTVVYRTAKRGGVDD